MVMGIKDSRENKKKTKLKKNKQKTTCQKHNQKAN